MLKDQMRKTSRAAILPFPGDPFLFTYWYNLFKTRWGNEVDKLYIYFNSPIEQAAVNFVKSLIIRDPKVVFIYNNNQIEHGEAINRTLDAVTEEYIMLIEDDAFIWGIGVVAQAFNMIECGSFDIVASKRGSCGAEILKAAQEKWQISYEGYGDQGPNFWPNFFFCKKSLLLKTDRNFGSKLWKAGEKIKELDYVCQTDQAGDTFVSASLQLRNLVSQERIFFVPQYHGHPLDLEHYDKHEGLFDGKAPWCHIGSLSSGIGGLIKDDQNRSLSRRLIDPPGGETILGNEPTSEFELMEYERRVQWWLTFYWFSLHIGLAELKGLYLQGINRIIEKFKLNRKRIERRRQIYSKLINGDKLW